MNSLTYSQMDLPMEIEESTPRPIKSSVMDTCVRFIYCNRLNYFRSYREDRKAVCFELPICKERIKPWVWIEDIMKKRQLRLTTYNTDVALRKDVREAVESVGELWKMEYPRNNCHILFRTKYVRIRKIVPYNLREESLNTAEKKSRSLSAVLRMGLSESARRWSTSSRKRQRTSR